MRTADIIDPMEMATVHAKNAMAPIMVVMAATMNQKTIAIVVEMSTRFMTKVCFVSCGFSQCFIVLWSVG